MTFLAVHSHVVLAVALVIVVLAASEAWRFVQGVAKDDRMSLTDLEYLESDHAEARQAVRDLHARRGVR